MPAAIAMTKKSDTQLERPFAARPSDAARARLVGSVNWQPPNYDPAERASEPTHD